MKNFGKIIKFNGAYGNIKGTDGKDYILLDKNIIDKNIKVADDVEFEPETIKTPEIEVNVAVFVKTLKKNNNNSD